MAATGSVTAKFIARMARPYANPRRADTVHHP